MEGLFIGIFCFVMMSVFYSFVKKQNSCFMEKVWPVFVKECVWSAMLAITGVMFLWSMSEIKEKNSYQLYETLHINDVEFLCSPREENQNSEV